MQESHLTKLYSSLVHTIGTSYTHVYFAWTNGSSELVATNWIFAHE